MKAFNIGGQDAQQAILTEILRGYHELAQDIGDPEVLGGYAEKTKVMSKEEVRIAHYPVVVYSGFTAGSRIFGHRRTEKGGG
jgi:hypothetical protein